MQMREKENLQDDTMMALEEKYLSRKALKGNLEN